MKKIFIILIIYLLFFTKVESQINYTISINASGLNISSQTATDGNIYSNVNLAKLSVSGDTGKPELPVKYVKLYIPDGKDVDNISFTTVIATTYNLTSKIFPVQKPRLASVNSTGQGFVKPDTTIYNSNVVFPSQMVNMVHNGYFDIKNRIITIAVIPFQYYPLINKLDFYSSINITVNLKQSANIPVNTVINRTPHIQAMYADILKNIVDNPQDIPTTITTATSSIQNTSTYTLIPYDYIIITDTSLVSYFASFMDWKKRKGINIGIISKQYIYNHYIGAGGDLISSYHIADTAGCVRQFLYDAYNNGTAWVLLAGDMSNMAVRNGCGSNGSTDWLDNPETDMYFEDFETSWNNGSNTLYGETTDYSSWHYPDVFVGRLLCSTQTDITNWTNHVLSYEQHPGKGDSTYLIKSFFIQSDGMQNSGIAQTVGSNLPTNFNNNIWGETTAYNSQYNSNGWIYPSYTVMGTPKGSDIIEELNVHHYGLFGWFCHGGTGGNNSGINTMTSGDCSTPYWKLDAEDANEYIYETHDNNNGLDDLTNDNYPSIIWSLSCVVTPYDRTKNIGNSGARNSGEAFTTLQHTGGVAFLGNTRDGDYSSNCTTKIGVNFMAEMALGGTSTNGYSLYHLGVAEELSKDNTIVRLYRYSHNLIGCPETEMWTDIPQNLDVTVTPTDLTLGGNNTVTVTINNLPYGKQATVCLYKVNDIFLQPQDVTGTGNPVTATFYNVQPGSLEDLNVTVTSHNYIPSQNLISVCAYNTTPLAITSNQTWNDVRVYKSDITVYSGATLTINNKTFLNHNATFTIKSGATLIVNTTGAILGGCDISLTPTWDGTFVAELGAILIINAW